ncbi:MAG: PIN domain-containing protein [Betaproteobacteria bacterium]|nr:MAG: PIN domain-containing protein [Betaproteobacteria bacterium]
MRIAIDTNVLAYAEGVGDAKRCKKAAELVSALDVASVVLPAQVLGELYSVLTRKASRSANDARDAVLSWGDAFDVADSTHAAITAACDLASTHRLQFWDAVILSLSVQQRCRVLLSEDLQAGFVWQGLTVVNPFAPKPHALLARIQS